MQRRLLGRALAWAIAIGAGSSVTMAYQPQWLVSEMGEKCDTRDPKHISGWFKVRNITDRSLELRTEDIRTQDYDFRFIASQHIIEPNEEVIVKYVGAIYSEGKHQINAKVNIEVEDGQRVATHMVDFYFLVSQGVVRASTYEELFMRPDEEDKEMGSAFSSVADDGKLERSEDFRKQMPSVQRMIEMDPKSIYRIPTDSFGPGCDHGCGRGENGQEPRTLDTYHGQDEVMKKKDVAPAGTIHASGTFSYKGMDNMLHPAFGWRVRAWKRILGGIWIVAAEDWIQWDGSWSLNIPELPGQTRFQYVAFNRFFTPMNSSDDTYRWVGPIRDSIGSPHNEGSWFADTSGGAVRGLGEIYREGMVLWSKLYWEGGINPLRGSSIKVYFPNTAYDCGAGTGVPWSCANTGGTIWLIPSHASRNGVMQHELSHQINYEYWGNHLPPGSGGSHNLGSCYNPGLAVVEGFANFMVFWTQSARGSDPSTGFDFRVENPSFACASPKNKNESWVAAAFWDLHDTHGDGADNLWFIHPGAVPAIFLTTGMKNGMADFYPEYRARANAEHRSIIDAIFRQDNIIP